MHTVVKGGSIDEKGSHTELIANPEGSYAALWKLQQAAPGSTKNKPSFEELHRARELQAEKSAIADAAAGGLIPQPSLEKQVRCSMQLGEILLQACLSGNKLHEEPTTSGICTLEASHLCRSEKGSQSSSAQEPQ